MLIFQGVTFFPNVWIARPPKEKHTQLIGVYKRGIILRLLNQFHPIPSSRGLLSTLTPMGFEFDPPIDVAVIHHPSICISLTAARHTGHFSEISRDQPCSAPHLHGISLSGTWCFTSQVVVRFDWKSDWRFDCRGPKR